MQVIDGANGNVFLLLPHRASELVLVDRFVNDRELKDAAQDDFSSCDCSSAFFYSSRQLECVAVH
jgi:hypothetical protein